MWLLTLGPGMHSKARKIAWGTAGIALIVGTVAVVKRFRKPVELSASESSQVEQKPDLEGLKSQTSRVGPATIETYVKAPGTVDFHPKHALRIHSAYSGLVLKVNRNLGDEVQRGDVLATVEGNVGIQVYGVTSPIKGVVLSRNVAEGQSVSPEDELFSVGDTSVLQVRLEVSARDAGSVKAGLPVNLVTENDQHIRATIGFLTPILSEDTRTATALIDFTSPEALPGMFVTGAIVVATTPIEKTLPASFCEGGLNGRTLYVVGKEKLEERQVVFGARDYDRCAVLKGLEAGDDVLPSSSLAMYMEPKDHEHADE